MLREAPAWRAGSQPTSGLSRAAVTCTVTVTPAGRARASARASPARGPAGAAELSGSGLAGSLSHLDRDRQRTVLVTDRIPVTQGTADFQRYSDVA